MDSNIDKNFPENPFEFSKRLEQTISFLLLSDIHRADKKVEKLKNWYLNLNEKIIDYVIISGDMDTLQNEEKDKQILDKEVCSKSEAYISNLLTYIEVFSCPLIIIPGNHDPYSMFIPNKNIDEEKLPKLTQHSTNIHKGNFIINDELQIIGLGGSVPGFYKDDDKNEIWTGFPYSNDSQLKEDLNLTMKKNFDKNKQTILLTHVGPSGSSTSIDYDDPKKQIIAGSNAIEEVLIENQFKIFLNIHGHIHNGTGRSKINKIHIINPGSLSQYGDFAIIRIAKNSVNKKWILASSEFLTLDGF